MRHRPDQGDDARGEHDAGDHQGATVIGCEQTVPALSQARNFTAT
jgi:hypothetical protein